MKTVYARPKMPENRTSSTIARAAATPSSTGWSANSSTRWTCGAGSSACPLRAARCLPTTTSTSTCASLPTEEDAPLPRGSSGHGRTRSSSPTRATATWLPSARPKPSMQRTEGRSITSIFINNAVYGMTGGQMAPTTMIGQKTSTSPYGRRAKVEGYPLKITNLIAMLPGAAYVTRTSLATPAKIRATKKAIKKAFEVQIAGSGIPWWRCSLPALPTGR